VGIFNKGLTRLLLIGCAASSVLSLNVQAEGDGVIVLQREVQAHHFGRDAGKDPNPTTVNANPSARINGELSDGDFADIASGTAFRGSSAQNMGGMQGLNVVTNPNGMPGMSAGHQGGSGSAISGTINRAVSSGLAPLGRLAGGQ
jgi:hypothetical protein